MLHPRDLIEIISKIELNIHYIVATANVAIFATDDHLALTSVAALATIAAAAYY